MDVIGVGFGRTGTLSLKAALETLGFGPCAHMLPLIGDRERCELWSRAAEGDDVSLDEALAGYAATVDWPGVYFWRTLVERHPDAKVVLTDRDPDEWYASARRTIWAAATEPPPPGGEPPAMAVFRRMCDLTNWRGTFGGRFADPDHAKRVFTDHTAAVRREVPAGRLLEYRVGQGWGPLCDFLGRPVPGAPFPRLNDTAAFNGRRRAAGAG